MKKIILLFYVFLCVGCSQADTLPGESTSGAESVSQTGITLSVPLELDIPQNTDTCFVFEDFSDVESYGWGIVNDGVMGGKSQGNAYVEDTMLIFSGNIVTRGGGFSSLRGVLDQGILTDSTSVKFKAKSDGREYRITFRDRRWGNISHRTIIPFQDTGEFEEVTIPFIDLQPAYFGRSVDADPFNKESAREIGVILSDGVDGEFELVIDEVSFCR